MYMYMQILYYINTKYSGNYYRSFNNKLKTNPRYLNYCANRQCDDLIEVLLIIEDLFHDRMRKEIVLTPMDATLKDRKAPQWNIYSRLKHNCK